LSDFYKEWGAAGHLEVARVKNIVRDIGGAEGMSAVPQLSKPRRNRIASRISRYAILAIMLVLLIAGGSTAYFNPNSYQWATEVISKIASFLKLDYSQRTAQVLVSRGNVLRVKKQYEEAEEAYIASIEKFTLKENRQGLGNAYTELGILHARTKKYESSKRQFQQAIDYFAGDLGGLGYASINLAQVHLFQGHFQSAKKYFLIAKQHYKDSGNQEGLGNVTLGLGNLSIAKKDYPEATEHFIEAEVLFKGTGNRRGLVNVYNSLSHAFRALHTKRGKEEANRYYQLAKSIGLNTHTKDLPVFSIRESFAWLVSAFDQHQDIYKNEKNLKAKQETERVVR